MDKKVVVACALGECVHVAGVVNFLRLAELAGGRRQALGLTAEGFMPNCTRYLIRRNHHGNTKNRPIK